MPGPRSGADGAESIDTIRHAGSCTNKLHYNSCRRVTDWGVRFAGSVILAVARTDGNVYFLDASDGGQQGALPTSEKLSITAGLSFIGSASGDIDRHGTQE